MDIEAAKQRLDKVTRDIELLRGIHAEDKAAGFIMTMPDIERRLALKRIASHLAFPCHAEAIRAGLVPGFFFKDGFIYRRRQS